MITFKTINASDHICSWKYDSAEELEREWRSDDINMDVPANDDYVFDVEIDGEKIDFPGDAYFEDLLTFIGIEIWA